MITLPSAGLYFDVSLTYIIEPRLKTGRNNKSCSGPAAARRGAGEDRDKFLSTRCNKTTFDIAISEVRSKIAAAILPYKASLEPSKVHSKLGALINELK